MTDARPKHKPNEKHTLDEVLKSLKDLVHGEVLDQPAPPPAQTTTASPAPTPPMADMRDIISSLEDLLESDLNLEEKVELAKAALAPVREARGDKPKPRPVTVKPSPKAEAPSARPTPPPAAPQPPPARPTTPPPPVTPMFDTEDGLIFEDEAAPAETPAPLDFPEEMSDDDIAKALADIQFEMDAAPAPQPEPETIDAAPPPTQPVPPLALAIEEPAELAQKGSPLELAASRADNAPDASGLSLVEDEITAAPAPEVPSPTNELTVDDLGATADEIVAPAAPPPAEDFSIDLAPPKAPPAEPDHVEDLAPPPWEEEEISIDRAEPPIPSGEISGGSLGESVDIDLSVSDTLGGGDHVPETIVELAPAPETPVTEVIAPPAPPAAVTPPLTTELKLVDTNVPFVEPQKKPTAKTAKDIPVLKDIAVASATSAAATAPAATPAPKPKPAPPAAPESFSLEMTPATPPKPAPSQDLHQMAVRIIAKLNIELRKAGKAPLDAKTINRLQQLLKEALEKK